MIAHRRWHWLAGAVALTAAAIAGVAFGSVPLSPGEVWSALRGGGDPAHAEIVRSLRAPRVLLAALVGAGLGASGAALQGALRNALAEPYLLGVSGGAAVGAVLAHSIGLVGVVPLTALAFAGAALAAVTAVAVARAAGSAARGDPRTLLVSGVVIGVFANAAIMVLLAGAPPNTVRGAMWWMMGSVADASWGEGTALAATLLVGLTILVGSAREIDVLALGEESAAALGVEVERATVRVFLAAALVSAATVAVAGMIGFVGLVVPHIVRAGGINRHRAAVGAAALIGGILVIGADLVARTAHSPSELPLGAVTALIGVPFFLIQLRRLGS